MFCLSRSRLVIIGKDIIHYPFGPWISGFRTSHPVLFCWMENIRILLQAALLSYCVWCGLVAPSHFSVPLVLLAGASLLIMHALQIWLTASKPTGLDHMTLLQEFHNATKYNPVQGVGLMVQKLPVGLMVAMVMITTGPLLASLFCQVIPICRPGLMFSNTPDHVPLVGFFLFGIWILFLTLAEGPLELWEYR